MVRQSPAQVDDIDDLLRVGPIVPIPYLAIDLGSELNPVPAIMGSAEFAETRRFFGECPSTARSLLSDASRALLYTVVRNLRPQHVVEIGTYKAGTTEGLARAVLDNGMGAVHTVGPFDAEQFRAISPRWPPELRATVSYYETDSMAFFMAADARGIRPELVFVDGNHDYEFANFDIQAAAQRLKPGGFIFVDNVSQAGPYFAAQDFLALHPGWAVCGQKPGRTEDFRAFDHHRTNIPYTDFIVLRAPPHHVVGRRPRTFGEERWPGGEVRGLKLRLSRPAKGGALFVQCVLRGFSAAQLAEAVGEGGATITGGQMEIDIDLTTPISLGTGFDRYAVEPWLAWSGDDALLLSALPEPY